MLSEFLIEYGGGLQFVLFFAGLAFFLIAERFVPHRRPTGRQVRRWLANASLTLLALLVLSILPVSLIATSIWAQTHGIGVLNSVALPMPVAITLTLLSRAFVSFGTHFLMHKIPLLWRFHRVHHLDTELDVSTTVRFHPVELILNMPIGVSAVALLGLMPEAVIAYELLDVVVTLFSHSNIRLPAVIERLLRFVIVTPNLHRVHHSVRRPETNSNYGAVFPVWDIVFGTFRTKTEQPTETMALGLEEVRDGRASDLGWLLKSPLNARFDSDSASTDEKHDE